MIISSYSDAVIDGDLTPKQYYEQFKTITPELGKSYYQHKGTWQEFIFTIIFVDEKIALGKAKNPFSNGSGYYYTVFISSGVMAGWKDKDSRPSYRLTEEVAA